MILSTCDCKDGGVLTELYKAGELGQVSMRIIPPGGCTGGSLHLQKDELWWIAMGTALVRLEFPNGRRIYFEVTGPAHQIIEVPAGTGHEVVNQGESVVVLFWHSSEEYHPEDPDRHLWSWDENS